MAKKKTHAKQRAGVAKVPMTVTASGTRSIHDVAKDLEAAGFEVGQVLDAVGSVTGVAHPDLKKKLASIAGVADVREAHEDFQTPPPDSSIQ